MNKTRNEKSPAWWIMTAYFAEGLPFVAIAAASTLMFKNMGISDTQIAFWTSLIILPWTLRPLWGAFLEGILCEFLYVFCYSLAFMFQQLKEFLESLPEKTGIPLTRTVLGGFSQGGAMTLDLGVQLPLAGMLILSGYAHTEIQKSNAPSSHPILMVHGRQDMVVPLNRAQQAKQTLIQQGWKMEYYEFDMGHEISLEALNHIGFFCKNL